MAIKQGAGVLVPNASNVKPDVLKMLVKLEPYRTPLVNWLFLSNKRSKVVTNPYGKFEWYRQGFVPHTFKVSTNITGSSSTWTLGSGNITEWTDAVNTLQVNDLVLVYIYKATPAFGQYVVLKVNSNNGTNVVLGLVDATLQSGVPADGIIRATDTNYPYAPIRTLGQLVYDGHGKINNYVSVVEENVYNYLKEFVYYVETTGRQQAGEYFTDGMSHAERVAQKFMEAKLDIERYLWFATLRGAITSGNNQATFGWGIIPQISTTETYATNLTESAFRSMLKTAFRYGSGQKTLFAGADLMKDIESFLQTYYKIEQSDKNNSLFGQAGLSSTSFRTFGGIVTLVWNPIFDNDWSYNGVILDDEQVMLRFMADDARGSRKLRVRDDVGVGYDDKRITEILADVGIQILDERTCVKIIKSN